MAAGLGGLSPGLAITGAKLRTYATGAAGAVGGGVLGWTSATLRNKIGGDAGGIGGLTTVAAIGLAAVVVIETDVLDNLGD